MNKKHTQIKAKKDLWFFFRFLSFFVWNKKLMIWFLVLGFGFILAATIIVFVTGIGATLQRLLIIPIITTLLFNVVYGANSAVIIFKTIESEGLEILLCTKPFSKKIIIVSKIAYLFAIAFISALLSFIAFAFGFLVANNWYGLSRVYVTTLLVSSFFVSFFVFLFFSLITALLALKLSRKIALSFAPSLFFFGFLTSLFLGYFSDTPINSFGILLGNYQNEIGFYNFTTNLNQQSLLLIPDAQKKVFDSQDAQKLKQQFQLVRNNAIFAKLLGWLNLPFQSVIAFSPNGIDLMNNKAQHQSSFLTSMITQLKGDDLRFNYEFKTNDFSVLKKMANNQIIVPTLPRIHKVVDDINMRKDLVYAWEHADSETELPQDSFGLASVQDYAGKLNWTFTKAILKNAMFQKWANSLIVILNPQKKTNLSKVMELLFNKIPDLWVNDLLETSLTTLEQYLYSYVAFFYYLYFHHFNSVLLNNLFTSSDNIMQQIKAKVRDFGGQTRVYFLGGYNDFRPIIRNIIKTSSGMMQETIQVARMQLSKGDTFLFSTIEQFYVIKRTNNWIPIWSFFLLWSLIILGLSLIVIRIYYQKEFK